MVDICHTPPVDSSFELSFYESNIKICRYPLGNYQNSLWNYSNRHASSNCFELTLISLVSDKVLSPWIIHSMSYCWHSSMQKFSEGGMSESPAKVQCGDCSGVWPLRRSSARPGEADSGLATNGLTIAPVAVGTPNTRVCGSTASGVASKHLRRQS